MSTILETATDVVATLAGHGPQHRYRQSVFDGNYDEGVCFDARRIRSEWEVDRQRYLSRVAASESLATEVPRLQAIAADVAKTLAEVESFARSPLPDSMTVAELRGKFTAAGAKIGDNTPAELSAVLQWYVDPMPAGHLGQLKSRAIRSQSAIGDCRSRVRQILGQTAADSRADSTKVSLIATDRRTSSDESRNVSQTLQARTAYQAAAGTECESHCSRRRPRPFHAGAASDGESKVQGVKRYMFRPAKTRPVVRNGCRKARRRRGERGGPGGVARLNAKLAEAHQAAL